MINQIADKCKYVEYVIVLSKNITSQIRWLLGLLA